MRVLTVAILACALAGCVSVGSVSKLDRDTYTIGSSTGNGSISDSELILKAAQKANQFCDQKGLDMVRVDSTVDSHRGMGNRDVVFNFRCVVKQQ